MMVLKVLILPVTLLHGRGCINDNSKKKLSLLFLLALAIFPLVSAVQIDSGTIVQSVGLNLTFNFTATAYADSFTTVSNSIYFENFRRSGSEYITMNLTQEDASYLGTDLPYFSSSSSTTKTITSTLSDSVTATVIVNADCDVIGTATYQGNPVTEEDCTNDQATFILTDIPTGDSILLLSENGAIVDICAESDITFMDAAGIAGILLTIILIGAGLAIMLLSFTGVGGINLGSFKPAELTLSEMIWGIIIVGLTFLIIATMAFVIGGNYCPAITA